MTNLKNINFGLNQYCGPAVLSALTGKSTDECAAVISAITGEREIRAITMTNLTKALNKLRFDVSVVKTFASTLFGTLRELSLRPGLYIIMVPKHFVAVEVIDGKIYLVDNASKEPLDASSSARLSQKVDGVHKATPRNAPKRIRSVVEVIDDTFNHINLKSTEVYEDERDNVTRNLGYIYFRDTEELSEIYSQLSKLLDKKASLEVQR